MAITMTESMYKELDKFFAEKTVHDVDRDSYLVCNLRDNRFKINISLIFMRVSEISSGIRSELICLSAAGSSFASSSASSRYLFASVKNSLSR